MISKRKSKTKSSIKKVEQNPSVKKEWASDGLPVNGKNKLTPHQVAPLLLDEWKYHNDMFSQAVYRYGLAEVFVTVAPYVVSGLIKNLGPFVFFFPALAIFLSLYGTYHLISLSMYVWQSDNNYRKVMGDYAPTMKLVTGGVPPKNFFIRLALRLTKSIEDALLLQSVTQQLAIIFLPLCWIIQFINITSLSYLLNKP
jgi:hypothetical protein